LAVTVEGVDFTSNLRPSVDLRCDREEVLLGNLDDTQRAAVAHGNGPLLVVAGPGSGKTRVLTHRVAVLIERGVPASGILAVTFTNKAAAEMRERLAVLIEPDAMRQLWVCTFHAACVRILRHDHAAAGLPRNFSIADTADTERLLRRIARDLHVASDDSEARKYASGARSAISWVRNRGLDESQLARHSDLPRIAEVAAEYRRQLAAAGAVDFDGLLLRTRAMFAAGDEAAQRWTHRFSAVLTDEAQDGNPIQADLVRHLAGRHGNLTAVGDLDQSVYAFRAADPESMARFADEWPGATVVILDRNYRSTAAIVEVAAAVIEPNPAVHRSYQSAAGGHGDAVLLRECDDDREEAAWVASMVRSIGGPLGEHAVLVRTNAQTRVLEEAFATARLPYTLIGAVRFFDRAEVRDAMAWLRAATNPLDVLAFERAAAAPRRGIGDVAMARLRQHAAGGDLLCAAEDLAAQGGRGAQPLASLIEGLRAVADRARTDGPAGALSEVFDRGLRSHWAGGADGETRLENLDELARAAGVFARTGINADGDLVSALAPHEQTEAFLEHAALVAAADDDAADAISVMTIHAAKGREFDVVYVVGLEEELLPHVRSIGEPGGINEERRLLFVAVSRARRRLLLSRARRRFTFGKVVDTRPSRFLRDLPESVVRSGTGRVSRVPGPTPRMGTFLGSHTNAARPNQRREQPNRYPTSANRRTGTRPPAPPQAPVPASAPGPRLEADQVNVGMTVRHPTFGAGAVTALNGTVATIRFADKSRTLELSFAPLEAA
jgi:DNA helicase II / ATP-dependent DNA helicase PcrA